MVDKTSRALRRHHRARMQRRAHKMMQEWGWFSNFSSEEETHRYISRYRDNMAICSCYACRNQRHNPWASTERLTMQERKENLRFSYDMLEVDNPDNMYDNGSHSNNDGDSGDRIQNSPQR